jgi:hypothetical protein
MLESLRSFGIEARPYAGHEVGEYRATEIGVSGLFVPLEARHLTPDGRILPELLAPLEEPPVLLLMLKDTPARDAVLDQLRELPNLVGLNVFGTQLSEPGLAQLRYLEALQNIELPVHVGDAGLRQVAAVAGLRGLFVPGNARITDAGMGLLDPLHLEVLHLRDTRISDAGVARLAGQSTLRVLNLAGTAVGDRGLEHLEQMPGLTKLDLSGAAVSEAALQRLRRLLPDCQIEMGGVVG